MLVLYYNNNLCYKVSNKPEASSTTYFPAPNTMSACPFSILNTYQTVGMMEVSWVPAS